MKWRTATMTASKTSFATLPTLLLAKGDALHAMILASRGIVIKIIMDVDKIVRWDQIVEGWLLQPMKYLALQQIVALIC